MGVGVGLEQYRLLHGYGTLDQIAQVIHIYECTWPNRFSNMCY